MLGRGCASALETADVWINVLYRGMFVYVCGFSEASVGSLEPYNPVGVRPVTNNLSEIVKFKTKNSENSKNNIFRFRARGHNKNHVGADPTPTVVTVDSGACDAVCPPHAFKNTPMNTNNHEFNKSYGACGGEAVKNIGCKSVGFVSVTGEKNTSMNFR